MDQRPIGVFDSGLGGLTAAKTLEALLPDENLIYFGDSRNAPYGTRPREQLAVLATANAAFLRSFDCKAILVACGTVSSNAMDILPNIGGSVDLKRSIQNLDVKGPVSAPVAEVPQQKKRDNGMPKHGALITAIGAIVTAMGVVGAVSSGLEMLDTGFSFSGLIPPVVSLCIAAAGLVAGIYGNIRKKKAQRFENYLKLIGDKEAVPIHYLADVMGIDYHKVIKDLREMITRGILQPAWLDLKTYRLMMTEYTESQAVEPEEKKEEAITTASCGRSGPTTT